MKAIKYVLAVIVVFALAEAAPEAVNAILLLILIGMFLMRSNTFAQMISFIGTTGK